MREATNLSWLHTPLVSAAHGLQQEGQELRATLWHVVNSRLPVLCGRSQKPSPQKPIYSVRKKLNSFFRRALVLAECSS